MIQWNKYQIPVFDTYTFNRKKYLDVVLSFDSEVTTFFNIGGEWVTQDMGNTNVDYIESLSSAEKIAIPYIWQMGINSDIIYGRTMPEFIEFIKRFKIVNPEGEKIIYVHNLGYDFEFICEYLPKDLHVFAKAPYRPMYAHIASWNVTFKCSYMLTNMSLDNCAKQFNLPCRKLYGNLDYTRAYLPNTPLTETELEYCERDIEIIYYLIRNVFIERYGCIANIPLTQTGEVRRELRNKMKQVPFYMKEAKRLYPNLEMYKILSNVLQGGYTHLNILYQGELLEGVTSFDKSSSYPDIMCTRKFPVGRWREITDEYTFNYNKYCYIMRIRLNNVQSKTSLTYIAAHKTFCKNARNDNGKILKADFVELWVTEIDLQIIQRLYNYDSIEYKKVFCCYKGYLPKEIIEFILQCYADKTQLKNIDDKQALYMRSKQFVNSVFGMFLSQPSYNDIEFNSFSHLWEYPKDENGNEIRQKDDNAIQDDLDKLKPFVNYSWGVWVTAYGRFDIVNVLADVGRDYVYSDTDSAKIIHAERHLHIFEKFNNECDERIRAVCYALDIDRALFYPKDKKGIVHPLGHFENEGTYFYFKSLGSKKYCYEIDNKFNCIVAGLRKRYLLDGQEIETLNNFNDFESYNKIPHGRTVHFHITEMPEIELTDYLGNKFVNSQKQGLAMLSTFFSFNTDKMYNALVLDVRNKYSDYFRGFEL